MSKGKFITFEGGDGSGKTTQLSRTVAWLKAQGKDVLQTFEPGDTPLGKELRRLLLSGEFIPAAQSELLLFLADRAQHVQEVIAPALEAGKWVVCDRYTDSTLAYQLAGRALQDTPQLRDMLKWAECGCEPDVTIWLDLSVQDAAGRMASR
ncbi:MAG: dTMP kinase, partial [Ghiorsea sp.]|nr:dTMP kinase [Ghiorsea sp.]